MVRYRQAQVNDTQAMGLLHARNFGVNKGREVSDSLLAEFIEL